MSTLYISTFIVGSDTRADLINSNVENGWVGGKQQSLTHSLTHSIYQIGGRGAFLYNHVII
jgi:hypothetical protein